MNNTNCIGAVVIIRNTESKISKTLFNPRLNLSKRGIFKSINFIWPISSTIPFPTSKLSSVDIYLKVIFALLLSLISLNNNSLQALRQH